MQPQPGKLGNTAIMYSSKVSAVVPSSGGVYAIWANAVNNAYIGIDNYTTTTSSLSSLNMPATLTSTNGYPIIAGAAPVFMNIPNGAQLLAISTSSGVIACMPVTI